MSRTPVLTALALLPLATPALAGGVDRGREPFDIIFEEGRLLELSFGYADPEITGETTGDNPLAPIPGIGSGDQAGDFSVGTVAIKTDMTEAVSLAFIVTEPFGAETLYPQNPGYFAANSRAELNSVAATILARYRFAEHFSVYGGPRYQLLSASARVPFVTNETGIPYQVTGDEDGAFGYSLGVAYERPEIALRVSLTYNSEIEHTLDATENSILGTSSSDVDIVTPQSVDLAFQTGVAPGTLVFGGVRWTDYTEFSITPPDYLAITGGPIVAFPEDIFTYSLGVGREINENLSLSASIIHEPASDELQFNLAPRDGETSVLLGAAYDFGQVELTGGIRYTAIGDAETQLGPFEDPAASFEDNDAVSFGLGLSYRF